MRDMKEKTPSPKKTSTPLKSINEKIASSMLKEMLSGKNVPGYKPPKTIHENTMSDLTEAFHQSDKEIKTKPSEES